MPCELSSWRRVLNPDSIVSQTFLGLLGRLEPSLRLSWETWPVTSCSMDAQAGRRGCVGGSAALFPLPGLTRGRPSLALPSPVLLSAPALQTLPWASRLLSAPLQMCVLGLATPGQGEACAGAEGVALWKACELVGFLETQRPPLAL